MAKTKQSKKAPRAPVAPTGRESLDAPSPQQPDRQSIRLLAIADIPAAGIRQGDRVNVYASATGEVEGVFLMRVLPADPRPLVASAIAGALAPSCTMEQVATVSLQLANLRRAP